MSFVHKSAAHLVKVFEQKPNNVAEDQNPSGSKAQPISVLKIPIGTI